MTPTNQKEKYKQSFFLKIGKNFEHTLYTHKCKDKKAFVNMLNMIT